MRQRMQRARGGSVGHESAPEVRRVAADARQQCTGTAAGHVRREEVAPGRPPHRAKNEPVLRMRVAAREVTQVQLIPLQTSPGSRPAVQANAWFLDRAPAPSLMRSNKERTPQPAAACHGVPASEEGRADASHACRLAQRTLAQGGGRTEGTHWLIAAA